MTLVYTGNYCSAHLKRMKHIEINKQAVAYIIEHCHCIQSNMIHSQQLYQNINSYMMIKACNYNKARCCRYSPALSVAGEVQ